MKAATPAESARTEDPGLSIAKEAAEVVPAESVRRNGNQHIFLYSNYNNIGRVLFMLMLNNNLFNVVKVAKLLLLN